MLLTVGHRTVYSKAGRGFVQRFAKNQVSWLALKPMLCHIFLGSTPSTALQYLHWPSEYPLYCHQELFFQMLAPPCFSLCSHTSYESLR